MQTAVLLQTHSPPEFSGGGVGGRGDVVGSGCISGGMDVVTSDTGTVGNR